MSWLSQSWRGYWERRLWQGQPPKSLNRWQEAFCEWNAERLRISPSESRARFHLSWAALPGGHRGRPFKIHAHTQMELCRPFWGNGPAELRQAYATHEPLQFLRLLSYDEPSLEAWPELRELAKRADPLIVDFGCGLAQFSITCLRFLQEEGKGGRLFLVDLPLLHLDFLRWLCQRWELPTEIVACTSACPIPALPRCDLCIATEILEHVHDPMNYLKVFVAALKPGGFLLTNLGDHSVEFFHVSPDLRMLQEKLAVHGWKELRARRLYQKP